MAQGLRETKGPRHAGVVEDNPSFVVRSSQQVVSSLGCNRLMIGLTPIEAIRPKQMRRQLLLLLFYLAMDWPTPTCWSTAQNSHSATQCSSPAAAKRIEKRCLQAVQNTWPSVNLMVLSEFRLLCIENSVLNLMSTP